MGDIFNYYFFVFYMYEFLQFVERVYMNLKFELDYNDFVKEFLFGIFQCKLIFLNYQWILSIFIVNWIIYVLVKLLYCYFYVFIVFLMKGGINIFVLL